MTDHKPGKDAGVRELGKRSSTLSARVESCKRAIINIDIEIEAHEKAKAIEEKNLIAAEKELATMNRRYAKAYKATQPKKRHKKKQAEKAAKEAQIAGGAKGGSEGRVEAEKSTTGDPDGAKKGDNGKTKKTGK